MSPKRNKRESIASTADKKSAGFTAEERAAMKARARELKAESEKREGEEAALGAIAKMKGKDHAMAMRIHEIVTTAAPDLMPKTWYGMPAYADKEGTVVCYFQDAAKFKARYATFGFTDAANLDEGTMWPVSYALLELTSEDDAKIAALVKSSTRLKPGAAEANNRRNHAIQRRIGKSNQRSIG